MALTTSNMLPLGTHAPDFNLPDTVSDKNISLKDFKNFDILVVMFICNHCPYVIHVNSQIVQLANDYANQNVGFVAISSNDVNHYPQDGPEKMKVHALEMHYPFAYLYDGSQEIAKSFDAACTPDFYVFDKERILQYRGRLDDSRPNSGIPLSGKDLRNAIDAILAGKEVDSVQYPSMGCNIKWK